MRFTISYIIWNMVAFGIVGVIFGAIIGFIGNEILGGMFTFGIGGAVFGWVRATEMWRFR